MAGRRAVDKLCSTAWITLHSFPSEDNHVAKEFQGDETLEAPVGKAQLAPLRQVLSRTAHSPERCAVLFFVHNYFDLFWDNFKIFFRYLSRGD
jgi:hypothetical protein